MVAWLTCHDLAGCTPDPLLSLLWQSSSVTVPMSLSGAHEWQLLHVEPVQ